MKPKLIIKKGNRLDDQSLRLLWQDSGLFPPLYLPSSLYVQCVSDDSTEQQTQSEKDRRYKPT